MKIEQLLVQHFYNTGKVTLQGIGSFILSPDFNVPYDNDKEIIIPEHAILFQYNIKSVEDDALITFIVQQTRKIKPLAAADLDSYLYLGKQFLNIGKPFTIEGLGILEKNQSGEYEFKHGHFSTTKPEAIPEPLREKTEEDNISFATIMDKHSVSKRKILVTIFVVILALIGVTTWYYLHNKKETSTESNNTIVEQPKTPAVPLQDSVKPANSKQDSLKVSSPVMVNNEGYSFKVVFKKTNSKEYAISKMNQMVARGHHVIMYTNDSVIYKLAEPFKLPLSDTSRIKDSLNKFYYGFTTIELQ